MHRRPPPASLCTLPPAAPHWHPPLSPLAVLAGASADHAVMAHASPASSPAASTSATAGRASSRRNQPRRRWLHLLGRPRATVTSPVAAIAGRASARAPSQPLLLSASWPTAAVPSAGNLLSPPSLRAPCHRRVTSRRPPAIAIVPPRVSPGLTPPRPHHRHRDGLSRRELALSRSGPNLAAGGGVQIHLWRDRIRPIGHSGRRHPPCAWCFSSCTEKKALPPTRFSCYLFPSRACGFRQRAPAVARWLGLGRVAVRAAS